MTKVLVSLLILNLTLGAAALSYADDDYAESAYARHLIKQTGINAEKAIDIALEHVVGTVYEYELDDDDDGHLFHEIKLINLESNEKYKISINVQTGMISKEAKTHILNWAKNNKNRLGVQAIQNSGFEVKDAISKVHAGNDLLVMDVEYKNIQGAHFFEIETSDNNGEKEWLLDISQKSIISGSRGF
ncbi:MAG: PepSY domain-containing protein [Gammaproteobacteria bacterium]|nr:PepSY domain-containing protein [Gammaproteobacteria bacterium]